MDFRQVSRHQQHVTKRLAHRQNPSLDNSRSGSPSCVVSDDGGDGSKCVPCPQGGSHSPSLYHKISLWRIRSKTPPTAAPVLHNGYPNFSRSARPSHTLEVAEGCDATLARMARLSSPLSGNIPLATGGHARSRSNANLKRPLPPLPIQSNTSSWNGQPFMSARGEGDIHEMSGRQGLGLSIDPMMAKCDKRAQGAGLISSTPRSNRSTKMIEDSPDRSLGTVPTGPRSVYFIAPGGDPTLHMVPDFATNANPSSAAFSASVHLPSVEDRYYSVSSSVARSGPSMPRSAASSPPLTVRGDSVLSEAGYLGDNLRNCSWQDRHTLSSSLRQPRSSTQQHRLSQPQRQPAKPLHLNLMDDIPPSRSTLIDLAAQTSWLIGDWLSSLPDTGRILLSACFADGTSDIDPRSGVDRRSTSLHATSISQPHATPEPEALSPLVSAQRPF